MIAENALSLRDILPPSAYDDDEEELPGRLLSYEEFLERLLNRPDIFFLDSNRRLKNAEVISFTLSLVAIIWISNQENPLTYVIPDELKPDPIRNTTVHISQTPVYKEIKRPVRTIVHKPSSLMNKAEYFSNRGQHQTGVGEVFSRVNKKGIFGVLAERIKSKDAGDGDLFSKNGYIKDINAIIRGDLSLKPGSNSGSSRKGLSNVGSSPGYGPSGFNGTGSGGIEDIIDNLIGPSGTDIIRIRPRGPPGPKIEIVGSVPIMGGRSRESIVRVVNQNILTLRYAYNKRLRENSSLQGKITLKFAIDEFGKVLYCEIIETTINDPELESIISAKVRNWRFDRIYKPGDITEIVYPFVFSS